jgi:ABC-type polysaccharide/polyol phosphate export permease
MYYMIEMFRVPIYEGVLPTADVLIPGILIALAVLLVGWVYFANRADEFAYTI